MGVRVDPAVHARIVRAAELAGMSFNQWGEEVLQKAAAENVTHRRMQGRASRWRTLEAPDHTIQFESNARSVLLHYPTSNQDQQVLDRFPLDQRNRIGEDRLERPTLLSIHMLAQSADRECRGQYLLALARSIHRAVKVSATLTRSFCFGSHFPLALLEMPEHHKNRIQG